MTQEERQAQGMKKLREIAGERAERPLGDWNEIAPDMRRYIVEFIAGDILSREGLDAKSRQLATVAMLAAMGTAGDEFKMHLGGALRLGWTRRELVEVLLQTAVFAGFPAALNALKWSAEVFGEVAQPEDRVEQARLLVGKIHAADAALDVEAFVALLTEDVNFRIGSQPALKGKAAVRGAISQLFSVMESIEHHTIQMWVEGDVVLAQAEVKMRTKSGKEVLVPYFHVLRQTEKKLFSEYLIYIDLGQLGG